jgi:hypothetical protein
LQFEARAVGHSRVADRLAAIDLAFFVEVRARSRRADESGMRVSCVAAADGALREQRHRASIVAQVQSLHDM